jgi:hypothetical protein
MDEPQGVDSIDRPASATSRYARDTAERGRVQTLRHGHLPNRPERGAQLFGEDLRLFPGGEVAAFLDFVVNG